jgi:hypothetical protein
MALFTDGTISTIEDLVAQDSAVLEVAGTENIDLSTKLVLAKDELGVELGVLLPPSIIPDLSNVVVTTPLRLWHTYQTLALVYRDAYYSQLNDRYEGKWREHADRAKWAADRLVRTGVGIVSDPLPRAEAPDLSLATALQPPATYYASVAWINRYGEEGATGDWRSLTATDGSTLQVRAVNPPANATGWRVYVGFSPEEMMLQNQDPIPVNHSWLYGTSGFINGKKPGAGQAPNYVRALPRILQRG